MRKLETLHECPETVRVWISGRKTTLCCCLMAPHPGHKHSNPRLHKGQADGWSPFVETLDGQTQRVVPHQ
jgi:hypothetical protein